VVVIGIDLGGTKSAAALFAPSGRRLRREAVELSGRGGRLVSDLIAEQAARLRETADAAGTPAVAVGVAVPGIYRAGSGTVWAPNIPGWDDFPLVAELEAALPGLRVRVDSDRACAVLGETWVGHARGCRNVVFLVVGTGIGAGILAEGRIVRGADDAAGAVGWLALNRAYRSGYGSVGCFEYHASGPGIAAAARALVAGDASYDGPLRRADPAAVTARDVFSAHDAGDHIAGRVLDDAIAYWGMAVANLVSVFNPEKVVFGGGIFGPAARFLDRIQEEAMRWAQPISMKRVRLEITALGGDAVLHGAGYAALAEGSGAGAAAVEHRSGED
jgi:glucokinase